MRYVGIDVGPFHFVARLEEVARTNRIPIQHAVFGSFGSDGAAFMKADIPAALVDFPDVTHDKLLVAAFGGFFMGAGIGLAMRGGSVLDGTEVLALALGRRIGITVGDVVMLDQRVTEPLDAYVQGTPKFRGWPGRCGTRQALQILSLVSE